MKMLKKLAALILAATMVLVREQSVSIHTPVYTFPLSVSTAAPTPPEHICSDITFGTATASAAAYNFSHSVVIESPFRFTAHFALRC